jgi:hypothetical protein
LVHRDRSASPGGSEGDARFGPFLMRAGANPCARKWRDVGGQVGVQRASVIRDLPNDVRQKPRQRRMWMVRASRSSAAAPGEAPRHQS